MIKHPLTKKELKERKELYEKAKNTLTPNKKSGEEILSYLKSHYPTEEIPENGLILYNLLENDFHRQKLSGKTPKALLFRIKNEGTGKALYENQDEEFLGSDILLGIELETSFVFCEGSSALMDEMTAFAGLDAFDLENVIVTTEYLFAREKYAE